MKGNEANGNLSGSTLWATLGNIFYVGGRIVIIIILTKFFPSDQVGRILYALAVVTPLSFLINMELRSVFVTDTLGRIKVGHCLSTRLVSNIIFILLLLVLCGVQRGNWNGQKIGIILLAGAVRSVETWADVYLGVFQKSEQMKRWAVSQAIKTTLVLSWVLIMPLLTENIMWMLVGWLGATIVVMWFYDRVQAGRLAGVEFHWESGAHRRLVRRGFPMGVFVT